MKVFVPEEWGKLREELEKIGRVITVQTGDVEGQGITFGDGKASIVAETDFHDLLEFLADCGYEFVALKDIESEYPKYPTVSSVADVMELRDLESIKSLVNKVKTTQGSERCGAIGIFVGFVREQGQEDKKVVKLEYEENEDIFDASLTEIENKLKSYQGVVDVRIHHKTGTLLPGEDIIYVVVMGEHREDVWEPLEKSMDIIKKELPIWKKEVYVDGEMWAHDRQ
ncbi:MAG: molybdenum cofactor biosynthesis protein MoaE [Archaeoglobaceae archaeon]